MVLTGPFSVAGFLTGVVDDYGQRSPRASLPHCSPPGAGGSPLQFAGSPRPPTSGPRFRPQRLQTRANGVAFYKPRGEPVTHAQMADYLSPGAARLSPRERHSAQRQWREAQMYKWLMQKAGHYIPRTSLTEERRAALKECFNLMDADGSGEIDFGELAVAMRALGFGKPEIREAISVGDHDGDGSLDFDEFISLIMQASTKGGSQSSQDSDGASFPFALIADSYRITRLVDSYKPSVREAALGYSPVADGAAQPSHRPPSAASTATPPGTPRSGQRAGSARSTPTGARTPSSPRASSARRSPPGASSAVGSSPRKAGGGQLPTLSPVSPRRPATAHQSPTRPHRSGGVRFVGDGGGRSPRAVPASAQPRARR